MKIYWTRYGIRETDDCELSVKEAVEGPVTDDDRDGEIETLRANVNDAAKAIGVLAQIVFDAGLMKPEHLKDMLGLRYVVEDE